MNTENAALFYSIELTHPKIIVINGERYNHSFQNICLPLNFKPIRGTARFIEGWEVVG